jgi:23S rRNA (adenine2503-C2)-methyltransferase
VDITALQETLKTHGEPAFRARQVWAWVARGATGYDEMTDLPAPLRARLAEQLPISTLDVEHEAHSRDGTVKTLFRTGDGLPVEAVLMQFRDGRRSVCLSSQSGCPLTCTFCATGQMRFRRNLTASEMLDQALHFRRLEPIDHAVFMGMGEPMLNVDEVIAAARRLPDLGVTHRRTTVSTVGWLPGLRKFVDEVEEPVRLALSLHAAEPALRSQLMPVNDRYPLPSVLAECRRYFELRRRKVFVEYVMLAGVNDRVEQARSLAELLDPKIFKVNLIPYNPPRRRLRRRLEGVEASPPRPAQPGPISPEATELEWDTKEDPFTGSSPRAIAAFESELRRGGIPTTVRLTRGRDIAAACGQLAASA